MACATVYLAPEQFEAPREPFAGDGLHKMMLIGLLLVLSVSTQLIPSQDFPTRPCKLLAEEQTGARKLPPTKKNRARRGEDTSPDKCIELHASALEAQEYLQKFVRERHWTILDELVSEDVWNFSVELTKPELSNYTKPEPDHALMNWRGGRASVRVSAKDLPDGYTRVEVSARFEGFGESEDQFATKRVSWPLKSSGTIESLLVSAVQSHANATH